MVEVLILATGQKLNVTGDVNYTKSVANIGDISKVNSSFTWSLKFPKTPNNAQILEGLGIVGSESLAPYKAIKVAILDNGFSIVRNGNLQITETNPNEYKGNIKDGIIDFFNAMGDESLADLDLSSIDHDNTKDAIFDTWTNPDNYQYRYLLANYNGQFLADVSGISNYANTSLVPSVKVSFLMNKLFERHGWTYSGLTGIADDFLSYPFNSEYDPNTGAIVSEVAPIDWVNVRVRSGTFGKDKIKWSSVQEDINYIDNIAPEDFKVMDTGHLQVMFPQLVFSSHSESIVAIYVVASGNTAIGATDAQNPTLIDIGQVNAGQMLRVELWLMSTGFNVFYVDVAFQGNIFIYRKDVAPISFSSNFEIYKQKDFIKEIMMQYGVIAIADTETKHIDFVGISERLAAPVTDWSKYFVAKKSEQYLLGSYAQNNLIKMKYDADGFVFNNGNIQIQNENLKVENTLFESNAYSAERNGMIIVTTSGNLLVPTLKNFEIEMRNDENILEAQYKVLAGRFFFSRARYGRFGVAVNGSMFTPTDDTVPMAVPIEWSWLILNRYTEIGRIINNAKIVTIELALPNIEVLTLDFKKKYFFSQLGSYFLLDKLTYKAGQITTADFIKID